MKIGSLFTGYGGLDMAIGGELAWVSEIEKSACVVHEAHHPNVPNLGDIKKIDWTTVPKVDVLTGGYPCQPFSHAGLRKGENDERHLWPNVREAISVLRPRLVLLENVRGHVTLGLREVLGEIAELGYGARWGIVRASDAGAPHQRARVFIAAYPEGNGGNERPDGFDSPDGGGTWLQVATRGGNQFASDSNGRQFSGASTDGNVVSVASERSIQPASDTDSGGHGEQQDTRRVGGMEAGTEDEASERERSRGIANSGSHTDWGKYTDAIVRWEKVTGRRAPFPTVHANGKDRLNPVFCEWMMGLPLGWVTGHGLSATKELKMLGNGVVPQQARLAVSLLERMN